MPIPLLFYLRSPTNTIPPFSAWSRKNAKKRWWRPVPREDLGAGKPSKFVTFPSFWHFTSKLRQYAHSPFENRKMGRLPLRHTQGHTEVGLDFFFLFFRWTKRKKSSLLVGFSTLCCTLFMDVSYISTIASRHNSVRSNYTQSLHLIRSAYATCAKC